MKLSVVIVNYNVYYFLEQCLLSLFRATEGIETEVFVVDNHSQDDSVRNLHKRFARRIKLIESNHNLGFARANNIAIRQASGEYVLLLNPDTFVSETAIAQVLDFMDSHPNAGAAGVQMHNSDGTLARESRRGLPTPWVSLLKMCGFSNRYYMSHLSWDEPGRIEVMSGAFMMLRRTVIDKVGMLDEDFFMYGEDIDLSSRILKGGYENWYVPAKIVHYKGESTQKTSFRYVHVFYQAMLIFFRKHYGHLSFLITMPIKTAIYGRALIALFQMQYHRLRKSLGFFDRRQKTPIYMFVGSRPMLNKCRRLAFRKGLEARFACTLAEVEPCDYLVYDTDSFSYGEIIETAGRDTGGVRPLIGTYSRETRVLITPFEVIV